MDSPSIVVGRLAESIDRRGFRAPAGDPSPLSAPRNAKESTEHLHVSRKPVPPSQTTHEQLAICTLRVKPDRRRMHMQLAPGADRRRT
jgi:hypothetical protein